MDQFSLARERRGALLAFSPLVLLALSPFTAVLGQVFWVSRHSRMPETYPPCCTLETRSEHPAFFLSLRRNKTFSRETGRVRRAGRAGAGSVARFLTPPPTATLAPTPELDKREVGRERE